ncbi:hypothetical protein [Erythrobacter sp. HL-111]|uniref:hypothetical protein n=1 Tax=Erythrobacter sp. HL-111 TaxID=1798193 RepID=UPI0006D995DE|nr:hypothetical protein [Erythrobacter sp. HL-111]KPP95489.1 MAG: hypothetical protein HLUCCO15_02420 [Erythrobacteraceae bacterium HL-111]SDS73021.1 hypothetical protein SAMN04515621_2117 [Erythrobacter sp. HL-111]
MPRPSFRAARSGLPALCAALALAACGGEGAPTPGAKADGPADPPGAALPLSIGNAAPEQGDDAFAAAVNCAAALDLTAERLAQMSAGGASREIDLIGRASDFFTAEAERAGANEVTSPAAAIARRKRDKAGETTEQAQLAIVCLRRFGEELG